MDGQGDDQPADVCLLICLTGRVTGWINGG